MSTNIVNQVPFLRTSRNFPQDAQPLSVEINRSYVDTAEKVNDRVIGIFPTTRPAITGEKWFMGGTHQQTLRQVYPISAAGNTAHNINFAQIYGFTRIFGTFTDGTNWYPLPYVDAAAATNQVEIIVTSAQIQITRGAGAPAITKGFVVLEWLSNV